MSDATDTLSRRSHIRQINMTKGPRDEGLGLSVGQFEGADPAVQLGFSLSVG